MKEGVGNMLRLAIKENVFLVLLIFSVAVFATACGEEDATIPALSFDCTTDYAYTLSGPVVSQTSSLAYTGSAGVATALPAIKVTITGGVPPFQISSGSYVVVSSTSALAAAFSGAASNVVLSTAVAYADDPSCSTYEFWMQAVGTYGSTGTFTDTVTVRDFLNLTAIIEFSLAIS